MLLLANYRFFKEFFLFTKISFMSILMCNFKFSFLWRLISKNFGNLEYFVRPGSAGAQQKCVGPFKNRNNLFGLLNFFLSFFEEKFFGENRRNCVSRSWGYWLFFGFGPVILFDFFQFMTSF